MTVDGQEVEVQAGNMILVDKGESRGIRATETMIVFAPTSGTERYFTFKEFRLCRKRLHYCWAGVD